MYIALLNHHVLFELAEKLALEKELIPFPSESGMCISKCPSESRDGLVLLPANYNEEKRNSKIAQVETCT